MEGVSVTLAAYGVIAIVALIALLAYGIYCTVDGDIDMDELTHAAPCGADWSGMTVVVDPAPGPDVAMVVQVDLEGRLVSIRTTNDFEVL